MYIQIYYFEIIKIIIILCILQHHLDSNLASSLIFTFTMLLLLKLSLYFNFNCVFSFNLSIKKELSRMKSHSAYGVYIIYTRQQSLEPQDQLLSINPFFWKLPLLTCTLVTPEGVGIFLYITPLLDLQLNKVSQRWASEK